MIYNWEISICFKLAVQDAGNDLIEAWRGASLTHLVHDPRTFADLRKQREGNI
jgi:hypothetical protein